MAKIERVLDQIHGLVEFDINDDFDRMCWRLINARALQRLRRVKQLGFSDFVFPGACHTRFAHSIGVFHTARRLDHVIHRLRPGAYDTRRGQIAVAAALVHDVGHGPFSHAFEAVVKQVGIERHEATSVRIIKETEIRTILDDFVPQFANDVAVIINNKIPDDLHAAIVSSQFDADRLDYMQRDRIMTGTKSSGIDFDWILANLEIRRVSVGQDETVLKEIETLVVGQKAVLAAEAYVLGLFHLYPTIYYHKATRSAEKICGALLYNIFKRSRDGDTQKTGLPEIHPLVRFAKNPEDLGLFQQLDDSLIFGALPLLADSTEKCISELSTRLMERKLYKAIDVTAKIETSLKERDSERRDEKRRKIEATIRERITESGLLDADVSSPRVLGDVVSRDPYRRNQGDDAALDMIYGIDRDGELKELSRLSPVVGALRRFETYRVYYRDEDEDTQKTLKKIIGGATS